MFYIFAYLITLLSTHLGSLAIVHIQSVSVFVLVYQFNIVLFSHLILQLVMQEWLLIQMSHICDCLVILLCLIVVTQRQKPIGYML